jgi:type IV secretion system protein TrbL
MLNQAARHRRWRSLKIPVVFRKAGRPLQHQNASDPMGGTGVIDRFLETFTRYIDSGFGLLGSEVGFLATTLAAIDITLAALFWAWGTDEDIIARLVKKTLFVGVFAYLIGNWNNLARIVFESFAGLGLKASGTGLSSAEFLRPGRIAQVGIDAGRPILDSISGLMGYVSFFENFIQIVVLLFAWVVVLLAFFILAIQLFVTLIEFKLTTLAGFVLIPFGLFGKTAFAAERVLGNVISSGVKVMVLAVIAGIGSTLFSQFTAGSGSAQIGIEDAMALVLAALALLGLGIFGPSIANGIVSGGPQLGAGAAVGTGVAAGGVVVAGAGLAAGSAAALAGAARGTAALACSASGAFRASGLPGVANAGASVMTSPLRRAAASPGNRSASAGGASAGEAGTAQASAASPPDTQSGWASRMKRIQTMRHGASATTNTVRSADQNGGGASVDLSEGKQ